MHLVHVFMNGKMVISLRQTLFAIGLAASAPLFAAADLELVRGGVGVVGLPRQLAGGLDVDQNGRPELLVAGSRHVSFVEEDDSPRGYREVVRLEAPGDSFFSGALLVDVPGEERSLLLQWSERMELRDAATLRVKAQRSGGLSTPVLGRCRWRWLAGVGNQQWRLCRVVRPPHLGAARRFRA